MNSKIQKELIKEFYKSVNTTKNDIICPVCGRKVTVVCTTEDSYCLSCGDTLEVEDND